MLNYSGIILIQALIFIKLSKKSKKIDKIKGSTIRKQMNVSDDVAG